MSQQLTRAEVEGALHEVGELLARQRRMADIAIYGGAAILLQFEATFVTGDVDATVEGGDHGALIQATHVVADRHGWLRSWFSEAVANYVSDTKAIGFHAAYPSEERPGLRVYLAKPDYLLAMKLRALRLGSRDEADATLLARDTGIATEDAMLELLRTYFPKEPPDPRRHAIIRQFALRLHARPTQHPG